MAGCTETFACGHDAAETAVCETAGCNAEACAQCALYGRASEVLGEGPLGPGAPGPLLIPGVEQFSCCDDCGEWQCAEHKILCSCGDIVCECSSSLTTCDTCGVEGHFDCMRMGCGCKEYTIVWVCSNCPSQEDDGYATFSCAGKGECARSIRKSACTLCIDHVEEGSIFICGRCEEVEWLCSKHMYECGSSCNNCSNCGEDICESCGSNCVDCEEWHCSTGCLKPCTERGDLVCAECMPAHLETHAEEGGEEEAEEGGAAGGATSPTLTGKREREGSEGAASKRAK